MNHLRAVKCPNCGAPITMRGDRETCEYCGVLLERLPGKTNATNNEPMVASPATVQSTAPGRRWVWFGFGGLLLGLLLLLFFLALGWLSFQATGAVGQAPSTSSGEGTLSVERSIEALETPLPTPMPPPPRFHVSDGPLFVPVEDGADGAPQDLLLLVREINAPGSPNTVAYVAGDSLAIRWHSPPLGEDTYRLNLVLGEELIYLADKTNLMALNQSDGSVAWQASLADEVDAPGSCNHCFTLIGDSLVTLNKAGQIQSFAAATGQLIWTMRLLDTPRQLYLLGTKLGVIDKLTADDNEMVLKIINPADGTLVEQIDPFCPQSFGSADGLSRYSPLIFDASLNAITILLGAEPGCIQKLALNAHNDTDDTNAANGANEANEERIIWQTTTPEIYDWARWMSAPAPPLLMNDKLYLIGDSFSDLEGIITVINTQDGTWYQLPPIQDYDLTPLTVAEKTLIVRAVRTRGSEREEVWGLAAESGAQLWQYVLQAESYLHAVGGAGDGEWAWRLTPNGLVVLQVLPEPSRLIVETLNPQSGVSNGQVETPLASDTLWGITWHGEMVWLQLRALQGVDLATGAIVYTLW